MHTRQWPGVRPWADFLGSFYAERYNLQSQTLQLTLLTLPQFVMVPSRNLQHMRGGNLLFWTSNVHAPGTLGFMFHVSCFVFEDSARECSRVS